MSQENLNQGSKSQGNLNEGRISQEKMTPARAGQGNLDQESINQATISQESTGQGSTGKKSGYTLVGLFDQPRQAEAAITELKDAGFNPHAISVVTQDQADQSKFTRLAHEP